MQKKNGSLGTTCKALWVVLALLMLYNSNVKAQQEPMYSQYMFNLLHVNPAYAGHRAVDNITLLGRSQWVGLKGAPQTVSATYDRRAEDSNVGYGIQAYYDQLGIEKTTGIQAFYAYHIPFESSFLSLGVSGGVLNYRAAYSDANPNDPGDPLYQQDANGWLPTAGFGALLCAEKWYVGLSVPALLHTKVKTANYLNQTSFGADNHYFLTGGYIFDLSESVKLKPSALMKAVRGAPLEFDFNMNAWFNNMVGVGVSYRTGDALVGIFELQLSKNIRLGYAYDYSISDLQSYNKGTHEILLRFEFGKGSEGNERVYSPRYY